MTNTTKTLNQAPRTLSEAKISRARSVMLQSQRFFGALALNLRPKPRAGLETMATEGRHLLYNPDWVDAAPMPELVGLTAKMALHIALLHPTRRRGRDAKRWKTACDYAANPILIDAGFTLPEGALINPAWKGKSAEEICQLLPEDESGAQGGAGDGQGGDSGGDSQPSEEGAGWPPEQPAGAQDPGHCGQVLDAETEDGQAPSPADIQQIEADAQTAVVQAKNLANAAGQGHHAIERIVDAIKEAHVDWREELRRFIQQKAKDDITWARPNRRLIGQGLYLPSAHSEQMGDMVIAVDTSGSVYDWLQEFGAQVSAIVEDLRPRKVWVIYVTDRVEHVDEYTPEDLPLKLTAHGMGGTSFKPPFAWVEEEGMEPAVLVYLTDLMGEAPQWAPEYPVVWACTTDLAAPWGDVVRLKR